MRQTGLKTQKGFLYPADAYFFYHTAHSFLNTPPSSSAMVEFNPDGSIKLPGKLAALRSADSAKMKGRCIMIHKDVVSATSPKSCVLHITLSDKMIDDSFVEVIYRRWSEVSEVPSKLTKLGEKGFRVDIGTCFSRCSDCSSLIRRYREYDSDVIEQNGTCTYKGRPTPRFCEEDCFE
jgi:hypothetical protein